MSVSLKLALWNANGLTQHRLEIETFLISHKIDIMLISETRFTNKSYIKIPKYNIYDTKHPDGRGHGGTAIIIKSNIKNYEIQKYDHDYLQATIIIVEDWNGSITISAIYCPPRHTISNQNTRPPRLRRYKKHFIKLYNCKILFRFVFRSFSCYSHTKFRNSYKI